MSDQDEDDPRQEAQLRDLEHVSSMITPRLKEAGRLYNFVYSGLLASNGAGAAASLAVITATWRDGMFFIPSLLPLTLFVFGFLAVGASAVLTQVREAKDLSRMERANSWLDFQLGDIKQRTKLIGLTFADARTRGAVAGAILFAAGTLTGLAGLYWLILLQ